MSTEPAPLATLLALAAYAAVPAGLALAGVGLAVELALELAAVVILLLAARLGLVLAGSALLAFLPASLAAGFAANRLVAEVGVQGTAAAVFEALLAMVAGLLIYAVTTALTRGWRPAATAGASLTLGALALALLAPQAAAPELPADLAAATPGLMALAAALIVHLTVTRATGLTALAMVRQEPLWGEFLGVPTDRLARQLLLAVGLLTGLAAVPLLAGQAGHAPESWPPLWIGILATVILGGRNGIADTLFMGLPVIVLPRLLHELLPELPDLIVPAALLALLAATLSHRGRRPGEPVPATPPA